MESVSVSVDNQGIRAVEAVECLLCGATGMPLHTDLVDRHFGVAGNWSLLRCRDCGLVWIDPRPVPQALPALYAGYHTHRQPERMSFFKRAVRRGVPAARLGYADRVPRSERVMGRVLAAIGPLREIGLHSAMWLPAEKRGRLLDVGCGAGAFLAHMQGFGWDVAGVDADEAAVAIARDAIGSDAVHVGDAEAAPFEPGSFDVVTLSHVVEHLPDPEASLRRCWELLRPGGRLVVSTPNARSLGARRFGSRWRGWEPPRHLFVFDAATLPTLVERAGFRTLQVEIPSAAAYFVWLGSAVPESVSGAQVVGVSTRLAGVAFWAWEHLLVSLGRRCGEEVVVVAEREAH